MSKGKQFSAAEKHFEKKRVELQKEIGRIKNTVEELRKEISQLKNINSNLEKENSELTVQLNTALKLANMPVEVVKQHIERGIVNDHLLRCISSYIETYSDIK